MPAVLGTALDLAAGMACLHARDIVHGDLAGSAPPLLLALQRCFGACAVGAAVCVYRAGRVCLDMHPALSLNHSAAPAECIASSAACACRISAAVQPGRVAAGLHRGARYSGLRARAGTILLCGRPSSPRSPDTRKQCGPAAAAPALPGCAAPVACAHHVSPTQPASTRTRNSSQGPVCLTSCSALRRAQPRCAAGPSDNWAHAVHSKIGSASLTRAPWARSSALARERALAAMWEAQHLDAVTHAAPGVLLACCYTHRPKSRLCHLGTLRTPAWQWTVCRPPAWFPTAVCMLGAVIAGRAAPVRHA